MFEDDKHLCHFLGGFLLGFLIFFISAKIGMENLLYHYSVGCIMSFVLLIFLTFVAVWLDNSEKVLRQLDKKQVSAKAFARLRKNIIHLLIATSLSYLGFIVLIYSFSKFFLEKRNHNKLILEQMRLKHKKDF